MEAKTFPVDDCPICLEKLTNVDVATGKCGHMFHLNCVMKVVNKKCPTCRQSMVEEEKPIEMANNPGIGNNPDIHDPVIANDPDWRQPNESEYDFTIRQFKLRKNWSILNEPMIVQLFQEYKGEMMHSMTSGSNVRSIEINVFNKGYYRANVAKLLNHCLANLHLFENVTEIIDCAISCAEANNRFKTHVPTPPGCEFIKFPNILCIGVKQMDVLGTWKRLLELPDIQAQLMDQETLNECGSVLGNHGEMLKLQILNDSIPSKCNVM